MFSGFCRKNSQMGARQKADSWRSFKTPMDNKRNVFINLQFVFKFQHGLKLFKIKEKLKGQQEKPGKQGKVKK